MSKQTKRNYHNGFELSPEQAAIGEMALAGAKTGESLKIFAYAGTGKTFTLTMIASLLKNKRGLYLAFNTDAKKDAAKKFKAYPSVDVMTTHGCALRWLQSRFPAVVPMGRTYLPRELIDVLHFDFPTIASKHYAQTFTPDNFASYALSWIAKFCNSADAGLDPNKHVPLNALRKDPMMLHKQEIADKAKISEDELDGQWVIINKYNALKYKNEIYTLKRSILMHAFEQAKRLFNLIRNDVKNHPISHDIYLKLWSLAGEQLGYDYIMLDEAQDTNGAVIYAMEQQRCQKIIVGDSHQQIYSFRGAVNAMEQMGAVFKGSLSTSYRYGVNLGHLASEFLYKQKGVPARINGFGGVTTVISKEPVPYINLDAVLCRNNGTVLSVAIDLLDAGMKPKMLFRDGTAGFKKRLSAIHELLTVGRTWQHSDYRNFGSKQEFIDYLESDLAGDDLTLYKIIQKYTLNRLYQILDQSSRAKTGVVVVTTAHKSKGLEWDRVKLANDFPENPEGEEANLLYVALTRAKRLLDISDCAPLIGMTWGYDQPEDDE